MSKSMKYPTKVDSYPMQVYASATDPQLQFSGPLSFLSPPPLGRIIVIACHWTVILYMMTSTAVFHEEYYWERVGFRSAWSSVTQVPPVHLLASKSVLSAI